MLTARIIKQHNGCYLIFIENEEHTTDIIEVEKIEIVEKTNKILNASQINDNSEIEKRKNIQLT